MSKITWLILILLGIILAFLLLSNTILKTNLIPSISTTPTATPSRTVSPTLNPGAIRPNITLATPLLNSTISNPVTISGSARVFENVLNYRLKDTAGNVLATGTTTANSPDVGKYGPYEVQIKYNAPSTKFGYIEVYSLSPKDGQEINLVTTYIQFGQ